MRALQVHYTSCRRGRSGNSGFQVRSASAGLTDAELLEIARLGNYTRPRLAEGAADDYPVSLRYRRLASGRYALIHSSYAGADYSGRDGNFMAHTLVPEHGTLSARPTRYLDWPGWQTSLPADEDRDEAPPALPAIEVATVDGGTFADSIWVTAVPGGRALLTDLMAALLLSRSAARPIVICDLPDRGWRWISCLLDMLPLATALDLSISTYEFDAASPADINATTRGSNFEFTMSQLTYRFFLCDPIAGVRPKLPDSDQAMIATARCCAETLVTWYLDVPERLRRFHSFMDGFAPCPPDLSLAAGIALFEQAEAPQRAIDDIEPLTRFITAYTRPDRWPHAVELMLKLARSRPEQARFEEIDRIVELCCSVRVDDPSALAVIAYRAWADLLLLALHEPARRAAREERCWTSLAARFDAGRGAALLLSDARITALCRSDCGIGPEAFSILARAIARAARIIRPGQVIEHPAFAGLVAAAMVAPQPLVYLIALFAALPEAVEAAALFAKLAASPGVDIRVLAGCLFDWAANEPRSAWCLRRRLYDKGLVNLLLAEFSRLLVNREPRGTYRGYVREAAAALPDYHVAVHTELTRRLWKSLTERQRGEQAWEWLNAPVKPVLPNELWREVVVRGSCYVPIDPDDASGATGAKRVAALAAAMAIRLTPNRPQLRCALGRLAAGEDAETRLTEVCAVIGDLDIEEGYRFAVTFVLRCMLPSCRTVADHVRLVTALCRPATSAAFAEVYGSTLDRIAAAAQQPDWLAAPLVAWLRLAGEDGPVHRIAGATLDRLVRRLAARRDSERYATLDTAWRLLDAETAADAGQAGEKLARFEETILSSRSSTIGSLRQLGGTLLGRVLPFRLRR